MFAFNAELRKTWGQVADLKLFLLHLSNSWRLDDGEPI